MWRIKLQEAQQAHKLWSILLILIRNDDLCMNAGGDLVMRVVVGECWVGAT